MLKTKYWTPANGNRVWLENYIWRVRKKCSVSRMAKCWSFCWCNFIWAGQGEILPVFWGEGGVFALALQHKQKESFSEHRCLQKLMEPPSPSQRRFRLCIPWAHTWAWKFYSGGKSIYFALSLIKRKVLDYGSSGHIFVRSCLNSEQTQSPLFSLSSQCHASEAARILKDEKLKDQAQV